MPRDRIRWLGAWAEALRQPGPMQVRLHLGEAALTAHVADPQALVPY